MSLLNELLGIKYLLINENEIHINHLIEGRIIVYMIANDLDEYSFCDYGVSMEFKFSGCRLAGFISNKEYTVRIEDHLVKVSSNNNTPVYHIDLSSVLACIERDEPLLFILSKYNSIIDIDTYNIIASYILDVTDVDNDYDFIHGSTRLRFQYYGSIASHGKEFSATGYICNNNYIVIYKLGHEYKSNKGIIYPYDSNMLKEINRDMDRRCGYIYLISENYAPLKCGRYNAPFVSEFLPKQTKSARV